MSDDALLRRPIVVIGAPRSGTTVLSNLLSKHPQLCLIEEPRLTWRFGNDARSDMLAPQHARPEVRHHIRTRFAAQVRASGAARLLEKSPSNSLRVPFVDRVLDGCVFVHVLRDGVQSALSIQSFWRKRATSLPAKRVRARLLEMRPAQYPYYANEFLRRIASKLRSSGTELPVWGPRLPGLERMMKDLDLLEVAALQWRMCVEAACREGRKLPHDRYTELRLEDLDESHLRGLLGFCDLPPADEVLDAFRERFDQSAPSGRTKGAESLDVQRARELVEPTMAWLATRPFVERHLVAGLRAVT